MAYLKKSLAFSFLVAFAFSITAQVVPPAQSPLDSNKGKPKQPYKEAAPISPEVERGDQKIQIKAYQPNNYVIQPRKGQNLKRDQFLKAFLSELEPEEGMTLKLKEKNTGNLGQTHYKYNQYYSQLPVEGVELILHEQDGYIQRANGKFFSELEAETSPDLEKSKAVKLAKEHVDGEAFNREKLYLDSTSQDEDNKRLKADLVIAPVNGNYKKGNFH